PSYRVRMEEFGRELRAARELRGLSLTQVAEVLNVSPSLVGKVERAERKFHRPQVERLDSLLKAEGHLLALWANQTRTAALPSWAAQVVRSEDRAVSIQSFSPLVVSGALQTPGYAEPLIRVGNPDASEDEIATLVK